MSNEGEPCKDTGNRAGQTVGAHAIGDLFRRHILVNDLADRNEQPHGFNRLDDHDDDDRHKRQDGESRQTEIERRWNGHPGSGFDRTEVAHSQEKGDDSPCPHAEKHGQIFQ